MRKIILILAMVLFIGLAYAQETSMYVQLGNDGDKVYVEEVGLVEGEGVNFDYVNSEYSAIIKSVSGKSSSINFFFPKLVYTDSAAEGPSSIELAQSSQLLHFPYFRDVDKLEVYDSDRRPVLTYDLSEYRVCDFDGKCSGNEDINTCPEDCRVSVVKPSEAVVKDTVKVSELPSQENQKAKGLYIIIFVIIFLALVMFMMNRLSSKRKGQMTLSIILGIVIVFAIGIGLYFSESISLLQKQQESVKAESALAQSKEVQDYVEACIAQTADYVIPVVLRNGGYYVMPDKKVSYQYYEVPVYMDSGKESVPTLDVLKRQIAAGIDAELPKCLNGISDKAEVSGISQSQIKINPDKIVIDTNLPLTVKGEVSSKLVGFYVEVPATIMPVYNEAKSLYDEMKVIKGIVPISKLVFLAEKKSYKFVSDNVGDAQVYILRFDQYRMRDVPLEYSFAVSNPLKEGEHIVFEGVDYSDMFGLIPEESPEEQTP